MKTQVLDDEADALLAVCRTTYCRIMARSGGNVVAAKMAVRFELARAGFKVIDEEEDQTAEMQTLIAELADGRIVQHDAIGGWHVHWYPMDDAFDPWGPVPYLSEEQSP